MHVGTRELPDKLRQLSEGAVEAAHQVTGFVEDSAAAVGRTARSTARAASGAPKRRRTGGARSTVVMAALFVVAVVVSRWWARRAAVGDVPSSPPPDVAVRTEEAAPAREVDPHLA